MHQKRYHKKSTIHQKSEKQKVRGFLAKKSSEQVKKLHGIIILAQIFQRSFAKGTEVMLLRKIGNPGSVQDLNFSHRRIIFESYIKIKQSNGKGVSVTARICKQP